jgi:FAD/FMN-containing dehydrogenase
VSSKGKGNRLSNTDFLLDVKMTPTDMFGVNADALLKVKRKYDPDDVFNKLNNLGMLR